MKKAAAVIVTAVFCLTCSCSPRPDSKHVSGFAMDTSFSAAFYGDGCDAADGIGRLLSDIEGHISWSIEDSDVARINACGSGNSADAAEILRRILPLCEMTGGELSPLMRPLCALWDITGTSPRVPSEEEIRAVLPLCSGRVSTDGDSITLPNGGQLDLGAFGKGYACDMILNQLGNSGVSGAVVSVGGSILTYGQKPSGDSWTVSVASPGDVNNSLGLLSIGGTAFISTSGSHERFFISDGRRYHHILSPTTGYPAETGLASVTVIVGGEEPGGTLCDALSTACFLVGYERSLALLDRCGAGAVFVTEDGRVCTYNLGEIGFTLKNNDYVLSEELL